MGKWKLRGTFFTFIEKEIEALCYVESQETNFERTKKDVKKPVKSFAGKESYGIETQSSKGYSKPNKKDVPKFICPIGCVDIVAYGAGAAFNCFNFRNKMSKKERLKRVKKYGLCRK